MVFQNRTDAGKRLAEALAKGENRGDLVLGLPRGGVPVAFEVAVALEAPLDIFLVRKLGVPRYEELAMGAIASGHVMVLNQGVIKDFGISQATIDRVAASERQELVRREVAYRGNRPKIEMSGKSIILVDDGLATGASMRAAISALRSREPASIVVAVPTAPADTCRELRTQVEDVVCLITPQPFSSVGAWYADFAQTTDEEVRQLLERADKLFSLRGSRPFERGASHERKPLA